MFLVPWYLVSVLATPGAQDGLTRLLPQAIRVAEFVLAFKFVKTARCTLVILKILLRSTDISQL